MNSSTRFLFSFALGLVASVILASPPAVARPEFSAITVDARTGQILFRNKDNRQCHPASLTKMMTLYVLFQDLQAGRISLSTPLRISSHAANMAPSKLHLKPGSTITVEQAIKAVVTKSANDVAAAIAENLGGSESKYAARMTRVARSIGMSRTTFVNASGLPNAAQYTTARDMATLGLRLMRDFPQYYSYFRTTSFTFHGRQIRTHNRLVQHYAGTDGIKTGYIAAAGFNLVTSTRRGDKRLVGVVLGARSPLKRERYMVSMLERNFAKAKSGTMIAAIAGSSAGAINPNKAEARPESDHVALADSELATAAADIAQDGAETVSTTTPKVLQATLAADTSKPKNLPFAVVASTDQSASLATTSWNIQIGAFPDQAQADARITTIRERAGSLLSGKPGFTMTIDKNGQKIYRARFAGFDETEAKNACQHMKRLGSACLTIAPQG